MPVIRSEYSVEQFETVLQKFAHTIPRFTRVSTDDMTLAFYYAENGRPRRIRVEFHGQGRYWSFTIEHKAYMDSPHITKTTFDNEEDKEKIETWLKKKMGSETPIPRFTLKGYGYQDRLPK